MKSILGYSTSLLSGIIFAQGWQVFSQRPGYPGGEVLILPLFILLIVFGWQIGRDHGYRRSKRLPREGYSSSIYMGHPQGCPPFQKNLSKEASINSGLLAAP
jgi:hypothetical protein